MKPKVGEYNADSIQVLEGLEAVRKKLPMYAGGRDSRTIIHIIKEMISNSIDEALAGFGDTIDIILNTEKNEIRVRDYARGCPQERLDEIATKTHSSGKFQREGGSYSSSGGMNGQGLKLSTATGTLQLHSYRNGKEVFNTYRYNSLGKKETKPIGKNKQGTLVVWTPDNDVFTDSNKINPAWLKEMIVELSYPCSNITFNLSIDGTQEKIKSKNLAAFLTDNIESKTFLSPVMSFQENKSDLAIDCAFVWTKNNNAERSYVNLINTNLGGTHVSAFKTALTREFNKFFQGEVKGEELRRGLSLIISIKMVEEPIFTSQIKENLNHPSINAPLSQMISPHLNNIFLQYKDFFKDLEKIIEKERKKAEAMATVREIIKNKDSKAAKKELSDKYYPALGTKPELFLVEGNSAGGSIMSVRNVNTHALFALRGKVINCLKNPLDKVLKNKEIQTLIQLFGDYNTFKVDKFPFDKLLIATDADEDGKSIQLLILTFLYVFYPSLLTNNKVFLVETPLYIANMKSKTPLYLFSEQEMERARKSGKISSDNVSRLKGLAENTPDTMRKFAIDPNTRRLMPLHTDNLEEFGQLLEVFMGEDVEPRREFID